MPNFSEAAAARSCRPASSFSFLLYAPVSPGEQAAPAELVYKEAGEGRGPGLRGERIESRLFRECRLPPQPSIKKAPRPALGPLPLASLPASPLLASR